MQFERVLCLSLLLAGCAELAVVSRDYVEPTGDNVAKVRFSTNGELRLIPNRNCLDWSAPNSGVVVTDLDYFGGKPKLIGQTIGMKGVAPKGYRSAEVRVAGGQPLTVDFSSTHTDSVYVYTCKGSFTFLPKTGEEYQITVYDDINGSRCPYEPTSLSNPSQRVALYEAVECKR